MFDEKKLRSIIAEEIKIALHEARKNDVWLKPQEKYELTMGEKTKPSRQEWFMDSLTSSDRFKFPAKSLEDARKILRGWGYKIISRADES